MLIIAAKQKYSDNVKFLYSYLSDKVEMLYEDSKNLKIDKNELKEKILNNLKNKKKNLNIIFQKFYIQVKIMKVIIQFL